MKKLFIITLIISLSLFLQCYQDDYETFHLVYSITSIDENSTDIDITYKVADIYITEQTQTPFIYEQDVKLNETEKENFYYYLELTDSSDKDNLHMEVISNNNYQERSDIKYFSLPHYARGYLGFNSVTIAY